MRRHPRQQVPAVRRAGQVLRAAQCAEGWHLDTEPITDPPPPDEVQAMWVEHRAQAQAWRDTPKRPGKTPASWMS